MASKPGILTDWPWKHLGNRLKYLVLAPWVVDSMYTALKMMIKSIFTKAEGLRGSNNNSRDYGTRIYWNVFPFLLWRIIHAQIWISYSRFRTTKAKNRIVDKPIEFEQVDRESNWDDNIIFTAVIFYSTYKWLLAASKVNSPIPFWKADGVVMTILLHMGPVEFLYYWFHRALHHHFLYSHYHSHHHSSIVTEPVTSVTHPFAEHVIYFILFGIPIITVILTGTVSIVAVGGYITYIDFMNYLGHCNFELVTVSYVYSIFPLLKYLFYTPSFHSLHHTQFRTNYSLFMPIYDLIYGTMDTSSGELYKTSLSRTDEQPDIVHLTHLTTLDSIYQLQPGLGSLASKPYNPNTKWYLIFAWPLTYLCSFLFGYISSFVAERNTFNGLNLQTWVVPKYAYQYKLTSQRKKINFLLEKAILEAEKAGVNVISLGLLNQDEELNKNVEVYLEKHPQLKIRVVDGSSLTVALVINNITNIIPDGARQVTMRGKLTKVAYTVACILCQKGYQVIVTSMDEFENLNLKLKTMMMMDTTMSLTSDISSNLILSTTTIDAHNQMWLVGDEFNDDDQRNAPTGTFFIPFSQIPPWIMSFKNMRKDCVYFNTPAMTVPPALENIHSCEYGMHVSRDWLPRRVMSTSRVAGIVHALENWDAHECDRNSIITLEDVEKVWVASLRHGFRCPP
ncbi:protein ECERIFERUM 1-like isoform X1 [Papaver somniferum]|uniref:protein ECERIFERUM 1-like isoform X1 n=3 Tax=Papaver somniferum TaxID=3469 RepID=UPI000E6F7BFD|nr:protein ECERIFERUM 1-like isoform X1 [Papaver somniferum]